MKSLNLLVVSLLALPLSAFAQEASFHCQEIKNGVAIADFSSDSNVLSVQYLSPSHSGKVDFDLLKEQPTVLGGTLLILRSSGSDGYATINVDEGGTSTLQALGTSAYMTCKPL